MAADTNIEHITNNTDSKKLLNELPCFLLLDDLELLFVLLDLLALLLLLVLSLKE